MTQQWYSFLQWKVFMCQVIALPKFFDEQVCFSLLSFCIRKEQDLKFIILCEEILQILLEILDQSKELQVQFHLHYQSIWNQWDNWLSFRLWKSSLCQGSFWAAFLFLDPQKWILARLLKDSSTQNIWEFSFIICKLWF